jgi:acylphosphatase
MTQKPTTQTLYIQDEMVRHDLGSGATLIHDLTSDTYFYLDNIRKLCATLSGKVQGVRESEWNTLVAENTNVSGTADVKPGGKTKIIAGKTAKNYLYTATMKAVVRGNARQFLTMHLRGEVWMAPDIVLSPRVRRMEDATFVRSLGPFARAAKPLLAKFGKIKGYPVSSRQTSTVVLSRGDQDAATKQVMTETETATLISQEPLDPSLFIVPTTYRDVSPDPAQLPDDVRVTIIN